MAINSSPLISCPPVKKGTYSRSENGIKITKKKNKKTLDIFREPTSVRVGAVSFETDNKNTHTHTPRNEAEGEERNEIKLKQKVRCDQAKGQRTWTTFRGVSDNREGKKKSTKKKSNRTKSRTHRLRGSLSSSRSPLKSEVWKTWLFLSFLLLLLLLLFPNSQGWGWGRGGVEQEKKSCWCGGWQSFSSKNADTFRCVATSRCRRNRTEATSVRASICRKLGRTEWNHRNQPFRVDSFACLDTLRE